MLIGDTEVWNTVASESLDLQDGFLAGRVERRGPPLVEPQDIRRGKHRTHETEALLLSGRNIHTAPSDPHADYRSRRVGRSAGGRKRALPPDYGQAQEYVPSGRDLAAASWGRIWGPLPLPPPRAKRTHRNFAGVRRTVCNGFQGFL